ncbi:MAG: cyclodeaminase/cyclohydrolase family protein [Deltaproteobacteria bacterium]|nr:MAG: cyclodeaminase/cyclohydrolase family protein [Deltaproteobacteria bacterium]
MLVDLTIKEFLEKTASKTPVPGGGSGAALSAAVAAGLVEMVANLTIGKKGFEEVEIEMRKVAKEAVELKEELAGNIDKDAEAFNQVMVAFRLPQNTEEEKISRSEAIQNSLKQAALVPLGVAQHAFKVIELAGIAVEKGNKNAVTDGAVGAMMARTAVLGALLNVKINLSSIKDSDFVSEVSMQIQPLQEGIKTREEEILSRVEI